MNKSGNLIKLTNGDLCIITGVYPIEGTIRSTYTCWNIVKERSQHLYEYEIKSNIGMIKSSMLNFDMLKLED